MPCKHRWNVQKYRAGVEHASVKMYVITCTKCGETRTIEGDNLDLKKLLAIRRKNMGLRIALASLLGILLLGGGIVLFFSSASYDEQYKSLRGTSTGPGRASRRRRRDPGESRAAPKPAPAAVAEKPPETATSAGGPSEGSPAAGDSRKPATGMFQGLGPLGRTSGTERVLPEAGGAEMIALLTGETIAGPESARSTPEEQAAWEEMWRLAGERHRYELEQEREREVLAAERRKHVKAKLEAQFAEVASLKLGPGTRLTNWDGDALPDGVAVEVHFFDRSGRRVRPKKGVLTCSLLDADPGGKAAGLAGKTVMAEWRFEIEALSLEPEPRPPDWDLGEPSYQAALAWRSPPSGTQLQCTFVEPGGNPIRVGRVF